MTFLRPAELFGNARFLVVLCTVALLALAAPQTEAAPPVPTWHTTIAVPGAPSTSAFGLNNRGQIVGNYRDSNGVHAFLSMMAFTQPSTLLAR